MRLYVKAEFFNPAASVKDRLAISIIEGAERRGDLKPGQTVVEATSGNTGIGLAMVCAAKGYPLVVTMADSFSIERRRMMRFLGAKVVLTPRTAKGMGMYKKAQELAEANGWFYARQFETPDNATIHENTTARELLADFKGERLDYWVTGYGTGGTLTGVGRVLRKERPDTKIILSEPSIAQLLGSGIAQERGADHSPAASHSAFTPHPIQGWTPDFIPYVLQESVDKHYYDELLPIAGPDAIAWSRRLAAEEGIFTGISGGASLAAAIQVAGRAPRRLGAVLHAARHRRALPVDTAVRGRGHRHDAGGGSPVEVDARLPDACCVRALDSPPRATEHARACVEQLKPASVRSAFEPADVGASSPMRRRPHHAYPDFFGSRHDCFSPLRCSPSPCHAGPKTNGSAATSALTSSAACSSAASFSSSTGSLSAGVLTGCGVGAFGELIEAARDGALHSPGQRQGLRGRMRGRRDGCLCGREARPGRPGRQSQGCAWQRLVDRCRQA